MLTPELEHKIQSKIDPRWINYEGSLSYERHILLEEISRLRNDLDEQCRLLGMGSEREAKLLGEIERLKRNLNANY